MKDLKDLFGETLQDIYFAEHAILKALPKMAKKATAAKLKAAFESHIDETEGHIQRLVKVFGHLGVPPKGKTCDAIEGLIKEAESIMADSKTPEVTDAGLISSAQAVEHYEIARYGTLQAWAVELGLTEAGDLLEDTLTQEHACNDRLSVLAAGGINLAANHGAVPNGAHAGKFPAARSGAESLPVAHTTDGPHAKMQTRVQPKSKM